MSDYTWSKFESETSDDIWVKLEEEPEVIGGDLRYLEFRYSLDHEGAEEYLMKSAWTGFSSAGHNYNLSHPEFEDDRDVVYSNNEYRMRIELESDFLDQDCKERVELYESFAAKFVQAALENSISPESTEKTLLEAD